MGPNQINPQYGNIFTIVVIIADGYHDSDLNESLIYGIAQQQASKVAKVLLLI